MFKVFSFLNLLWWYICHPTFLFGFQGFDTLTPVSVDADAIVDVIPHNREVLQLDTITGIGKRSVTAKKEISYSDCQGHFDRAPVYMGALYLEMLGQLGSYFLAVRYSVSESVMVYSGVISCNFCASSHPGDVLEASVCITHFDGKRSGRGNGIIFKTDPEGNRRKVFEAEGSFDVVKVALFRRLAKSGRRMLGSANHLAETA